MSRTTPTLTQSGLLAVLLERQHRKAMQLARRRARVRQMRTAFLSAFSRRCSAFHERLIAATPLEFESSFPSEQECLLKIAATRGTCDESPKSGRAHLSIFGDRREQ